MQKLLLASLVLVVGSPSAQEPNLARKFDVLDFESLVPGEIASSVSGRFGSGPVLVHGTNPLLGDVNAAIAFDSSAPTGGDPDLGTPNEDFGGPGIGDDGGAGSPFQNDRPHRNLLVVGQDLDDLDGDGLVDDPGDANVVGSTLSFDFSALGPVTLRSLGLVDLEEVSPPSRVDLYDANELLLASVALPVVGDNGFARVDLGATEGVAEMVVTLNGSAAIDEILFEAPPRGVVFGRVWDDLDGDGLQAPDEPGLPGIQVELTGPITSTFETNAAGYYRIEAPPGTYTVTVDETTLPPNSVPSPCDVGSDDTIDSDCSPATFELSAFQIENTIDFGYGQDSTGVIGDRVFYDVDGDGLQGPDDPGLSATVFLYDEQGNFLATTETDDDGLYAFEGLSAGEYMVSAQLNEVPAFDFDFGPALCNVGPDDGVDSECGPTCVVLGDLLTGELEDVTIDFGFAECGECDGKVDALSLRYLGEEIAFVEVVQKNGAVVFSDEVDPDESFTFFGADNQNTLGPEIEIYVDGVLVGEIHTSCSEPIFIGLVVGDFEIVAGRSRFGGVFCSQ